MATKPEYMINGYGYSLAVIVVDSAFAGITWYICLSLLIRIWLLFTRYNSLYFWSLLIASFATFLQPTCFLLKDFQVGNINFIEAIATLSWYGMVTGQAVVLYSRLHLVVQERRKVKWVLWMICFNFVVLHLPTTVLTNLSHQPTLSTRFSPIYAIYEKIQLTGFFIQESIISAIYMHHVRRIVKTHATLFHHGGKQQKQKQDRDVEQSRASIVTHLLCVNVIVIVLDVALVSTEYANMYRVQTVFKCAVYSVKLELEFSVLNRLRMLVLDRRGGKVRGGGGKQRRVGNNGDGKGVGESRCVDATLKPSSREDMDASVEEVVGRDSVSGSSEEEENGAGSVESLDTSESWKGAGHLEKGDVQMGHCRNIDFCG